MNTVCFFILRAACKRAEIITVHTGKELMTYDDVPQLINTSSSILDLSNKQRVLIRSLDTAIIETLIGLSTQCLGNGFNNRSVSLQTLCA